MRRQPVEVRKQHFLFKKLTLNQHTAEKSLYIKIRKGNNATTRLGWHLCQKASRVLLFLRAPVRPARPRSKRGLGRILDTVAWIRYGALCSRTRLSNANTHHLLTVRAAASMSVRHQKYSGPCRTICSTSWLNS